MKKRLTAWLLTLSMLLTVFSPLSAFAWTTGGKYTKPVDSHISCNLYGYPHHTGVDFKASVGTTVVASRAGTVIVAEDNLCQGSHYSNILPCPLGEDCIAYKKYSAGSYGNFIIIDHGDGFTTYYCHLKTGTFRVKEGDYVEQGTILAESGAAGKTAGAHLHFEVRKNNIVQDPEDYLTNTYVEKDGTNTPANNLPVFFVDTAEASGKGQLHVGGWAYDPDDTGRSVEIRISVNGEVHTVTADKERSDVDNIHHCGSYHGFDTVFYTEQSGNVTVEVTAVDVNDSSQSTGPETRTVTVQRNRSPILNVDDVRAEKGRIRVAGWAYDPDDLNKAVSVHVYIGGEGHAILANNSRTDLDDIHHCGPNHGFAAYITTDKLGAQDVVLFAIDTEDSGRNTGSRVYSVNIAQDTTGPTISNLKVTNIDATGYTVTCTVTDANGVDRVQFPTWATSASDLPAGWETSSKYAGTKNGNTYTYRVKVSDFNNASGPYSTHVYAFDHFGNISMAGQNKILTLPTGIVINTSAPTIYGLNNTVKLTATISPSSATLKTVSWSSSDPKVATVSSDGTVKSVGYGTATIYAKTANGKTAAAKVTVAQTSQVTLSSIAVATMPNKTYYYAGEPLNTAGLTLKATYSDGSTKTITEGFTCSPTKLDTVNHSQPITVRYGGKTTTFTINVNEFFVKSIEIVSAPTKTTYCVGDTLDTTGLKIKAFYNSGSSRVVDTGFVCTPTTLNTAGTQTITVSYKDATTNVPKTATFDVTVQNVTLSGIAIASTPTKTSYFVGDTLDTTGLKLIATYNNGTTQTITSGFTCKPTALNSAGAQTVTVNYGGKTAAFTVNVQNVTLSDIAIASKPSKTSYFVGDTLDPTGLKLTATYNNGTTQTITSGFNCNISALNDAGPQTVTVSYGGKTATFTVNVQAVTLSGIAIASKPSKTSYFVGDTLDTTGLKLIATYNNGTTQTITSGFNCTPAALNSAGTQTVTVSYGGKTATFSVNVQNVTLSSIAIASMPSKTSYFVGDTLDTTGLKLTATYNNGTTQTITSGFNCTPAVLNDAGTRTVTVSYGGKTATFTVNVQNVTLSGIVIASNPTKTSYFVGDTLDTTGLKLTATYNNGTTQTITSGFNCKPGVLNDAGPQTVSVNYGGKTATFTVNVQNVALSGIAIASKPSKTSYFVGDTLDTTGLKLTATYNNGTTQTITSGFTCSPTKLDTVNHNQPITVSYGDKTATFTVNVQDVTLSDIAIASNPTKTNYFVGDTLDTTGLKLIATYNNGTTQTITSGFNCNISALNDAGTQTVTVNYGGKTATFTVSVELPVLPFVTLTFDPTDGVLDLVDTPEKTVYPGEAYGRLPEPTADGMVFLGWYTESGKRITSLTVCDLTGDATVSARWVLASAEGWSFDETTGTLTLDGSGAMKEYTSAAEAPWYSYRDSIAHLVVKSGVTSLSSYAFVGCQNLEDITLPDTLQTIGTMTFYGCDKLNNVTIPASVHTIGSYAFADALSLSRITFAGDAPEFGTGVFTFRKLTAYYPVYASGWETVVDGRYDFGGSITWVRSSESLTAEEPVLFSAAEPDDVLALDWTL